jgi:hypothetical protein
MRFSDWTPPDNARLVDLRPAGALAGLAAYYRGARAEVVHEVFGQAYSLGAQTAVIEYRYMDADYRSEYANFYSTTFRRYPSVAHRVHFFSDAPPAAPEDEFRALEFSTLADSYLGFVVLRPVPGARIGRVALAPPGELSGEITCFAREKANVFGAPLSTRCAPFMAQDSQLGVCAHMSLWVAARHHHLAFGHPYHSVGDIAERVPAEVGRVAPSTGLTVHQLAAGCRALDLPPIIYKCEQRSDLPSGESIPRIVCRYLNSGMPVIVAAGSRHAFCLVGYTRVDAGSPDERLHFVRQDDEKGPYQVVDDFAHDIYGPWQYLVVPLPAKVFVPGETAEALGREKLIAAAAQSAHPGATDIAAAGDDPHGSIMFRSAVVRSNRFKEGLLERGYRQDIAARYRQMPMSRWLWVVEAVRRPERNLRQPAVVAEALIDATDHSRDMNVLAWRVPGEQGSWTPDEDEERVVADVPDQDLVETVARHLYDEVLPKPPA